MGLAPDTLTFDRANPLRSGESRWSTSSMTAPTMGGRQVSSRGASA